MHLVNRTFDEIQVGEHAELRRLITPDDLYVFAVASGNFNPMHLPSQDVDGDGKPENIAPAMFVASLVASVYFAPSKLVRTVSTVPASR